MLASRASVQRCRSDTDCFVSADARNTLTEGCFCLPLVWPLEASRGFDPERRSVMVPGHSNNTVTSNRLSEGQR